MVDGNLHLNSLGRTQFPFWFVVAQFCGVLAQMRRALLRVLRKYLVNFA